MSQEAAVEEPVVVPEKTARQKKKPKRQPRYHVILWNDEHHTFDYVIRMMKTLFGHAREKGFQIAMEVHTKGKAVCMTTTLEHAELKRDQIHAFGRDPEASDSKGSMWSTIEPEC
jgi:ATP-dependent Clp protease adaptor protein ClpS